MVVVCSCVAAFVVSCSEFGIPVAVVSGAIVVVGARVVVVGATVVVVGAMVVVVVGSAAGCAEALVELASAFLLLVIHACVAGVIWL